MRIPNKFNGYMSDGRRLYPDPATSLIMAKALAAGATAAPVVAPTVAAPILTAAAVPGLVGSAAPALTGAAGTAASNLGTTAALEAGKQAAVKAGTDVMAQQAAQQVANQGAQQVAQAGVKEGIMQGADDVAAMKLGDVSALNPSNTIDPFTQAVPKGYEYGNMPNIANTPAANLPPSQSPVSYSDIYAKDVAQGIKPSSFNPTDGLTNVPKDVVGNPSLKMPGMEPLTTAKAPPNALERGIAAASKFASDHPYITAGGIMAAQNLSQPSYGGSTKKSSKGYGGGSGGDFKYTEPSTGTYTPIFQPTAYAVGGSVEQMSAQNSIGDNMMYPQSQLQTPMYANPMVQRPMPTNVISPSGDAGVDTYSGEQTFADGGTVTTGSGSIDLRVPINFGGPGIGGGSSSGYSTVGSGSGQGTSASTATGAPSQTAQPQPPGTPGYTPAPIKQIDSSAAAPVAAASAPVNRGNVFVPTVQWGESPGVMAGLTRPTYTVGDSAADAYVKANAGSNLNLRDPKTKAKIESLYQQYYRGYAKGGSVQGYASGGKMSAFERMMKEEKERQEAQQEAAQAAIEKGKSLNPASKPYSRTQSTNSPYAASVKELQAMGKKYGIPIAAPAKTNTDLMGDQDQIEYAANGGMIGYAGGGEVTPTSPEALRRFHVMGGVAGMGGRELPPWATEEEVIEYIKKHPIHAANGGIMNGLGGYSDGGRLLKGPGDGVSDSIPAVIGNKQPARLADGEFVIPARIVSELGNGSTEAGARKLYAMMERVQKQRGKTVGKGKVAVNSKASKHLPA